MLSESISSPVHVHVVHVVSARCPAPAASGVRWPLRASPGACCAAAGRTCAAAVILPSALRGATPARSLLRLLTVTPV